MKLRVKGNSLRLRITPSEMKRFVSGSRLEEVVVFGPAPEARLSYTLEHSAEVSAVGVNYRAQQISVLIPEAQARAWAESEEVGIYADLDTGAGTLSILVEKDFACLDRDEAENADTFPHPQENAVC